MKALFVTLTFPEYSSLWAAITADMGMSLLVIFNALRLLRSDQTSEANGHGEQTVDDLSRAKMRSLNLALRATANGAIPPSEKLLVPVGATLLFFRYTRARDGEISRVSTALRNGPTGAFS